MKSVVLSKSQARKIILHAGGLARAGQFGKGREAVYKLIHHLGFVQLDTNYTVERAHHHTIAARVPGYQLKWLQELQEEGRIFEFLTSDAGFMPMTDFRFSLPVKQAFSGRYTDLAQPEINSMQKVLDRVEREGPLMVKDFDNDRTEASAGWWDWRPAKIALERLYHNGSLVVTRDKGFHKIYDLPANIVPGNIDRSVPSPEEYARQVILRSLKSLGIACVKEINWRARFVKNKNIIKKELEKLLAEGAVGTVMVEGLKGLPLYILPAYKNKKIQLSGDAFILSPFDPVNVFRHRLRDFFDFDYQVECFVPAPKRKYGYFSLPVLLGEQFVARMDAKADRKENVLIIHNLHFEPLKLGKPQLAGIAQAIRSFAGFNQCTAVVIKKSNNKSYSTVISDGMAYKKAGKPFA